MTKTDDAVSQALDRVYAARPSEFVAARKKIVAELKAAGDREGAARVAEAHRPTATAWAINHVVRKNPAMVARFTDAIEALRKAQRDLLEGKGESAKMRAERTELDQRIAEILSLTREALEGENVKWSVTTQRRIATSLRTLPSATAEDRVRLLKGRLEKDLDTGDEDSLLETALGLGGVEIKRAPPRETPQKKAHHDKPAHSPTHNKEEARQGKVEEQRRREKEQHEREEKARRAAEQLARERAYAQKLKFLEREVEHLESKATYAEEAAMKARATADAARVALKKAKEQKP